MSVTISLGDVPICQIDKTFLVRIRRSAIWQKVGHRAATQILAKEQAGCAVNGEESLGKGEEALLEKCIYLSVH